MRRRLHTLAIPVILFLLICPAIVFNFCGYGSTALKDITRSLIVPLLIFLIPTVLFYRNIRVYFYLLLPLVLLTPFFLFTIFFFGVPPGFELIVFVLQTNPREASEAATPFFGYFVIAEVLFTGLYLLAVSRIAAPRLPMGVALTISAFSVALLAGITIYVNELHTKKPEAISRRDLVLKYDYPVTLLSGAHAARVFLAKNNLNRAEHFTFHAARKDSITQREVYVLVIGESSRHDRWQINGYPRPTSPRLAARKDLISFHDVIAGAHYTWVSVPQIITRAHPENYDLQYREKSILQAFREAGFKTAWLSNQSDQDVFWSGSITLHAKTADVSVFSPTWSPNLEFERVYDSRLLPLLDSLLRAGDDDLFVVLHTMGNHWDYSQRHPPEFDLFKPSGYSESINPPHAGNREAVMNSYDNSILFADFLIDSVISTVTKYADISAVTFISDHGEDLYDANPEQPDFHFRPSAATLRVPLFIWSSRGYNHLYPDKRKNLEAHLADKIGTENIFYTALDMANIRIDGFDSTKSIAHAGFLPSQQKYYSDDKRARPFAQIEATESK